MLGHRRGRKGCVRSGKVVSSELDISEDLRLANGVARRFKRSVMTIDLLILFGF